MGLTQAAKSGDLNRVKQLLQTGNTTKREIKQTETSPYCGRLMRVIYTL